MPGLIGHPEILDWSFLGWEGPVRISAIRPYRVSLRWCPEFQNPHLTAFAFRVWRCRHSVFVQSLTTNRGPEN
ncbi:MAG: hypothetical protein DWI00_02470 [Planctomycetota bacterium]|nr:MAG: hypothetical protein DWI00_02470 [Planctomycetota bacterium]